MVDAHQATPGATISGLVVGGPGPVPCATVRIQATANSTFTAADGTFALGGIPDGVPVTVVRLGLRNPLHPWALRVARGQTNVSLYARFFRDPRLMQVLAHFGYPVMDGNVPLGLWAAYFGDYYVPSGGMQSLADLLAQHVCAHGGQVHLGQRVDRILV